MQASRKTGWPDGKRPLPGFGGRSRPTGTNTIPYFELAVALAQLGRLEEARSAIKAGLGLDPTFTIARFSESPISHFSTYSSAESSLIVKALREVGMPEE